IVDQCNKSRQHHKRHKSGESIP
ncbi:hypothetical protein A5885_002832, partial [Enterococcus sp. 8E11_MSG4843]